MQKYELMVLFETNDASKHWDECEELVKGVLTQYECDITSMEKWGDRKLAYEINKLRRATYMVVYFTGEPAKIHEIDRDLRLKERVLRHMVLRDEKPEETEETEEVAAAAAE